MVVLPQHGGLDHLGIGGGHALDARLRHGRGVRQGRHAHGLAGGDAVGRLDPRRIDADLPGAAQLFNRDLVQLRKAAAQPFIKALFAFVFRDGEELDGHAKLRARARPAAMAARDKRTEAAT